MYQICNVVHICHTIQTQKISLSVAHLHRLLLGYFCFKEIASSMLDPYVQCLEEADDPRLYYLLHCPDTLHIHRHLLDLHDTDTVEATTIIANTPLSSTLLYPCQAHPSLLSVTNVIATLRRVPTQPKSLILFPGKEQL